jgi:very-short-patch-repair endonuclease
MVLVRSVTAAELSPRDVRRGLVEHFSGAADAAPAGGGIIGLGVGGGVDGRMSDGAGDGAGTAGGAGQGAVAEAGGTVPAPDADTPLIERCESGFERDVYSALTALGYRVTPQVRAGAYRIDLVVEGAGDRRLAIECDGDAFHGPDRWPADMARQRVLERAGWTFWRCFASTWTLRRAAVLQELQDRLQALDIAPLGAVGPRPGGVEQRVWPPRAAA